MEASNNTTGTGGAPVCANLKPRINTRKTSSGSWEAIAYNGGKFYSAATCKMKADAIAAVTQDLAEKGLKA